MFDHTETLTEKLANAFNNKGADYQPRTRYLGDSGKPRYINRLVLEDSPYLLQHAHNPVDWYPWGDEAFAAARQQNKPVFLSIGYATCHWCHVMEEESFDNEEVAQVMNDYFICIKVDRELHPDVDTYYMTAVMMMQGHGGWPMSSFLTPDGRPFFGATYFRPGQFLTLMHRVNELWQQQQQDLLEQAAHFDQQIAGTMAARQSLNEIGMNVIDLTAQALMNHYDSKHGGFGQAPKFPNEPYLYFLLDYALLKKDNTIYDALCRTLHTQACGGIYDHVGGGFHRYATDANWLVPHFEKMLYNQANLASVFNRAWALTRARDFRRITEETLDYVLHDMTHTDGGFYAATDADSEGEEGRFFIWDKTEIESLLDEDAEEFIRLYQISEAGNFEGRNIPNLAKPLEQYADESHLSYDDLLTRLNNSKQVLLEHRNKRVPPLRDDKIITAWNGLMIRAFAEAAERIDRKDYLSAACKAADYVLQNNMLESGELARSSLNGQTSIPALQEDYACLSEALLAIYDASHDSKWLQRAIDLTDTMIRLFWDEDNGGFFMGRQGPHSLLPTSPREVQDNATASGNSVALKTLTRLWRRTGDDQYRTFGQQLVRAFSDDITQRPYICAYMMDGLLELIAGEQSHQQWCCNGRVMIRAVPVTIDDTCNIELQIRIADDWHLNTQGVEGSAALPVGIELEENWSLIEINAPAPIRKQLGYQQEPVDVYEDAVVVRLRLKRSSENTGSLFEHLLKLRVTLQACNDEQCHAPESLTLTVCL